MQIAELEQRDRIVGVTDALLELLDGEPALEVMRAQQRDDGRAIAVAGTQRPGRHLIRH